MDTRVKLFQVFEERFAIIDAKIKVEFRIVLNNLATERLWLFEMSPAIVNVHVAIKDSRWT